MLQVARLAPQLLGASAEQIVAFLQEQWNADGGARDRAGASDLYYTVFALEGLLALQAELPVERTAGYLEGFGAGDDLDLVHVACLARCWASMPVGALAAPTGAAVARNLERFRSTDGGYGAEPGTECGTAYHGFLACGAHQDLGGECPDPAALAASVAGLRTADGGFANAPGLPVGSTPATAAAVTQRARAMSGQAIRQQAAAEAVGAGAQQRLEEVDPVAGPFRFDKGVNSWITSLQTMAEYLTMVEIYFGRNKPHSGKIVVPKKLLKGTYAGGFFHRILGNRCP